MKVQQNNGGFTVIELLVTVIISVILFSILGGAVPNFYRLKIAKVQEAELVKYAQKAQIRAIGCTDSDSDGDGYVSCDAETIPKNGEKTDSVQLDCAYQIFSSGCKTVSRAKFTGGQVR